MSRYNAENLTSPPEAPESALSQLPAQPTPASQTKAESNSLQSGLGNAMVAAAAAGDSPSTNGNHFSLQSVYGNATVARLLIQRKPEGETIPGVPAAPINEQPPPETTATPAPGAAAATSPGAAATPVTDTAFPPAQALIVEDTAETLEPGQMRKSEFLSQLRTAVCNTTSEALANTPWSEAGCPYIDRWFSHYNAQNSQYIERAIRRYAPEAAGATAATGYFPPITARVRRSVTTWATTGEITGVPEGVPLGLPGGGLMGAVGGALSGVASAASGLAAGAGRALSAVGGLYFKARDGGARETDDPQAIHAQLGAGQSLDGGVKSRMESAFGENFSGVQTHTDANAAKLSSNLNAHAFTVGEHVAFGPGEYQPGTLIGDALIAHELAHVLQQREATPSSRQLPDASENDRSEADADKASESVVLRLRGFSNMAERTRPALTSGLRLQRCGSDTRLQSASVVGEWQGKAVAMQESVVWSNYGATKSDDEIRAERTLRIFNSEAAALAAVKANGKAGAVTLEKGRYVAYETSQQFSYKQSDEVYGRGFKSYSVPRALPGVVALVSHQGVTLRPGEFNPEAKGPQTFSSEQGLKSTDDPFQGYKDAFGGGKGLDTADDETLLLAFTAAMKDTALSVLNNSEQVVRDKQKTFGGKGEGVAAVELATIKTTAKQLADLDRQISEQETIRLAYKPRIVSTGSSPMAAGAGIVSALHTDEYLEASKKLEALSQQRAVVLTQYPMLARVKPEDFIKLKDEEMLARLGGELPGILKDIAETRQNVADDEINLWSLNQIVDATIAGLGIQSEAKRKVIQDKAKSEAKKKTIKEIVKTIFMVGLGLAAAFVGGPLGLAFAAGALGLSLYDAIEQTRQYAILKPASNTDIDPSKSLVPPEQVPGWGWLVVAWVGVGIDAAAVVKAVSSIAKAERSLALAMEDLAEQNAKRLGVPKEELLSRLKLAAGEIDPAIHITEGARNVIARRLGITIEIDARLGSEVRIYYTLDEATGKIRVLGMRCGSAASVADVLAHQEVLALMRRYEGATGKVRSLWEKMLSVTGKAPTAKNPFPRGSAAFESWFEIKKLPEMIKLRTDRLSGVAKGAINVGQEAQLRAEVEFLENELAIHQKVVDQMVLEAGTGYIAKTGETTLEAAKRGFPLPDIKTTTGELKAAADLTAEDVSKSGYYYRLNQRGDGYDLVKKAHSKELSLRAETNPDGSFKGFAEGELTRAEKAEKIVQGFSKQNQDAFNALKLAEEAKGNRVVPIKGMAATDKTIGELTKSTPGFRQKLFDIVFEALTRKGEKNATQLANEAVDSLMKHPITVVQGTDQLRAFGYRGKFLSATGKTTAEVDDLHHIIPLYLGGDNRIKNLIDIAEDLHRNLHELIETVKYSEGVTLAPGSIQRAADLSFKQGAGILRPDGAVELRPFQ